MKAVVMEEFGGPDVLVLRDVPAPVPRSGEVVVKVAACGVCHLDLILRSGMRSRVKLPRVLGHELAGVVVALGPDVDDLEMGDRVTSFNFQACGQCIDCTRNRPSLCRFTDGDIGQTRDGGYAEFASVRAGNLVKVPDGMSLDHACFAACVYGPPYKAILKVGRIQAGQVVLVTGASGGLGLAAIQICSAVGGRSIAITSSEAKAHTLRALGANDVVVNRDGQFGDDVRKLTDGRGVDLVVELVGSPTFKGSLRSLAPGGRMALIGELHGVPVEVNLGLLIIKEFEFYGVQSANRHELAEVLGFMSDHKLEPVIWRHLPLAEAPEAHRLIADRAATGRIVLIP